MSKALHASKVLNTPGMTAVTNVAALRLLSKTVHTHASTAGYYWKGGGGHGSYWYDETDTTSTDNGGTVIVASDGGRWKLEISSSTDVRSFGAKVDGINDDSDALNNAIEAGVYLIPDGICKITKNIGSSTKSFVLKGAGINKTFLNCVSPTSNGRFGGSATNQSAVYSLGSNVFQPNGSTVSDLTINCNKLLNSTGSTGLKGLMFRKAYNVFAKRVKVVSSASYAFWLSADVGSTSVRCSGVFEDCEEYDSEIGFETVNPTKAVFNRCNSYKSGTLEAYSKFNCFHPYGIQADADVQYNNCVGIGEAATESGGVSTIAELGLECKNVKFNDSVLINKNPGLTAIALYNATGDFDGLAFTNCEVEANGPAFLGGAGALSTVTNPSIKFIGGSVKSYESIPITMQDNKAALHLIGTDIESTRTEVGAVAICIVETVAGTPVYVTGSTLKATGAGGQITSNCTNITYSSTVNLTPSITGVQVIRQKLYGQTAISVDGSNSFKVITLPKAVADESKCVLSVSIKQDVASSYFNYGITWGFYTSSEIIIRIAGDASAHKLSYSFYEYF